MSATRSTLLSAAITGLPSGTSASTRRSASFTRAASIIQTTASTSASASRTARLSRALSVEPCRVWKPGVSTSTNWTEGSVSTPTIRWRVVCGLRDVMLMRSPTRALTSVDLPTEGRPTIATWPQRCVGPSLTAVSRRVAARVR